MTLDSFFCPVYGPYCWLGVLGFLTALYLWYLYCPWDIPELCLQTLLELFFKIFK